VTPPSQAPDVAGTGEPTEQRSLGQLAVRGGSYLIGREAIGMVIRLVGVVLVVRQIGPGPYGIYSGAAAFVLFIATFAQLGLEVYLIKMTGEVEARHYNQAFTLLLVVSVAVTVIAEGLTFAVAGVLRPIGVLTPLRVLLLSVPINVLWAPSQAAIERRFGYRLMGLLELGGDVALYGTAIPLAFFGAKAWSLVAGYFAWQMWLFIGSWVTSGLKLRWDWSLDAIKDMTRHGLSYSTAQWVNRLSDLVNPLVVGTFFGAAGVGYVAFAQRLVDTVGFAKRGAYRLGMVAMSRVASNEEGRLRYSIEEGSLLQLLALAVPFACFGIAARWLVPAVFGHEWAKAVPLYSLLALATVLGAGGFIQSTFLFSRGRNMSVTAISAVQSVTLALAAVLLVKRIGLDGYGVAWLIGLASLVLADHIVRKMFKFSYRRTASWAIVLGPPVLFPLVPMPWSYLLLTPALLVLLPSMRAELARVAELIRSSIARAPVAPEAVVVGSTP
jgi:O-antigen/teichoic acid export membrane protein